VLRELHAETQVLGGISAIMQSVPLVRRLLALLVGLLDARTCVDVGTFTGASALAMAQAMPDDGDVISCEVNPEWAAQAERHWQAAGYGERIHLLPGPALVSLEGLPEVAVFDLAFIDADKPGYRAYYETLLPRVRVGGCLVFDDTEWFGEANKADTTDPDGQAMRALNAWLAADSRVETLRLPIGNGVTICRKRGGHHA
jgi:predicted O-methyltransferase YrrM